MIRRGDDPLQFPVVEPVEAAALAVVDDDVTGAAVQVRVHPLIALRAVDLPLETFPVGSNRRAPWIVAVGPNILDQCDECVHGDEHSTALATVEYSLSTGGGVNQRNPADRTIQGDR